MSIRRATAVLAVLLAVLLGGTGVGSARAMAPDRDTVALQMLDQIYGLAAGDLCGEEAGHALTCPLCHALPEAPVFGATGREAALVPHDGWRRLADLHRAAQARSLCHSPRAPPLAI
ncbi:hypothetical protein [Salipiger marinus]|uniref:Uncharacterized protein n=1 Tax=Salipiger marinus TaxID=555512 RepID=A0A1G8QBF4_9RHOB|nr:hypothetical protein [Salipiger marinus]SDJ01928.1 hypothetical protein SAMN04487993_101521 [Salipiger marinus]